MNSFNNSVSISFFGHLKIVTEYGTVDENNIRSPQICKFIAYLVLNRLSIISTDILTAVIWPQGVENPYDSLRGLAFRTKNILKSAFPYECLIVPKNGSYVVNEIFNLEIDTEILYDRINAFSFHKIPSEDELKKCIDFIESCNGGFLENYASDIWVLPVSTFYNSRILMLFYSILDYMYEMKMYDDVILYATKGLTIDPLAEKLHSAIILSLVRRGNRKLAIDYYYNITKMFKNEYNIIPTKSFSMLEDMIENPDKI